MKNEGKWIDVSVPIRNEMVVYPGDPPVSLTRVRDADKGDHATVSVLAFSIHSGTHMDAPLHFFPSAMSIDKVPLSLLIGKARIIDIEDEESIKREDLMRYSINEGDRILFKTRNSRLWKKPVFIDNYVHLSIEAALYLAARKVGLVGIDYVSVGGFSGNGIEVHRILLQAPVWLLEGLDLSSVEPGEYDMVCLPLKIDGAEAAPARVLLRPMAGQ